MAYSYATRILLTRKTCSESRTFVPLSHLSVCLSWIIKFVEVIVIVRSRCLYHIEKVMYSDFHEIGRSWKFSERHYLIAFSPRTAALNVIRRIYITHSSLFIQFPNFRGIWSNLRKTVLVPYVPCYGVPDVNLRQLLRTSQYFASYTAINRFSVFWRVAKEDRL